MSDDSEIELVGGPFDGMKRRQVGRLTSWLMMRDADSGKVHRYQLEGSGRVVVWVYDGESSGKHTETR